LHHSVASHEQDLHRPSRVCLGLAVERHPDVGGNAGVVEEVKQQGRYRLKPIVLDDPAAEIALALAGRRR
jgi:hypothetical protein